MTLRSEHASRFDDRLKRVSIVYAFGVLVLIAVLVGTGIVPLQQAEPATARPIAGTITPGGTSRSVVTDRLTTAGASVATRPLSAATVILTSAPTVPPLPSLPPTASPIVSTLVPLAPTSPMLLSYRQSAAAFAQGDAQGVSVDPDGALTLAPALTDTFASNAVDPLQWEVVPWGAGGTATDQNGSVRVNIAAIHSRQAFVHRTLEARVRFTTGTQPLQNLAWSADLNGGTAILIGEPPTDPGHLYARIKHEGEVDRLTQLPVSLEEGAFHSYRIAWEATHVDFSVDDVLRATIPITLDQPMFAWLSAASAYPLTAEWARILDFGAATGSFTSVPFDAKASVTWQTLAVQEANPGGTQLTVRTRSSTDGVQWSTYAAIGNDGRIVSAPGRYLQYQLEFSGTATRTARVTVVVATAVRNVGG